MKGSRARSLLGSSSGGSQHRASFEQKSKYRAFAVCESLWNLFGFFGRTYRHSKGLCGPIYVGGSVVD